MQAASQSSEFRLTDDYQALKSRLHQHLIRLLEDRGVDLEAWSHAKAREFIRGQVRSYVQEKRLPVNQNEAELLAEDTLNELIGFGPIQSLVDDDGVSDIVVNGPDQIFTERDGQLSAESLRFSDDAHVIRVIQRILAPLGRRVDESTPMVDARLPDGSRVNAIIPPIALDGPCVSIRKFRENPLSDRELIRLGSVTRPILDYLQAQVRARRNIIVIGGTGSGKTTFLNLISQWVPPGERIVTIEDAAELRLHHGHVVRLETRPPNLEGERQVSARDLVRNALRMRPDRIIVGEVRGDEVLDMLQAMNTGHDGSMTTLHANSPRDAVHRLQLLAGFAGFTGDQRAFMHQVSSALDLIVHVTRLPSGKRRLLSIQEVGEYDGHDLALAELFGYDEEGDVHHDRRGGGAA
jgi:pilus assembly protein CpaF